MTETDHEDISKQYRKFKNAPKYDLNSEELFCICRRPDHGEMMIACDGCEEWFHFKCMRINRDYQQLIAKFYCKFCEWQDVGLTKYKRKCRVVNCQLPISNKSKYCSEEHGKEFMKQLLGDEKEMSPSMIKGVLDYVGDDYLKLEQLGTQFPEVPEVVKFKQDQTIDAFPTEVQDELQRVRLKHEQVDKEIKTQEEKLNLLLDMKENMKLLNEKLTTLVYPEEPKKGVKKKVDLCLCNKSDENMIKQILDSQLINEIPDFQDDWFHSVCIKERKKCLRHNGWWNLSYDEIIKNLERFKSKKNVLNQQIDFILRNYSKKIYE